MAKSAVLGQQAFRLLRYAMAALGPVCSAGAQFALSLYLLHLVSPNLFGAFSFLLVSSQLALAIWSALFCAPLPALMAIPDRDLQKSIISSLFLVNLMMAAGAAIIFLGIGSALGFPTTPSCLFSLYVGLALVRWFGRAYGYATGLAVRTMLSDILYSSVLAIGVILVAIFPARAIECACLALLAGTAIGFLPFGLEYIDTQFASLKPKSAESYRHVWSRHSKWSLLGVLTTEATANCHVYIITLLYGPKAFAPIAASALLTRPIGVAMNALTEFERAQLGRDLAEGKMQTVARSVQFFRLILVAAWLANVAIIVALAFWIPRIVFPGGYDHGLLITGMVLWMAVAGMRLFRTPDSALLQAIGAFKPLANASVVSSGISVLFVVSLLILVSPLWSIIGILIGEAIYAVWIWKAVRAWRSELAPAQQ